MKEQKNLLPIMLAILIVFFSFYVTGCSADRKNFDVYGSNGNGNIITTVEDIKNLVTDDEKLVINYYDAYIWVVYYDKLGNIKYMTYIYTFSDSKEAESMVDVREEELRKNKTMTILNAYTVDKYIVVDLTDTSFTNLSRSVLENNFSGLVVY